MKCALSLPEGGLAAGRWHRPDRSWWGVGAGERRGIMELTGDLSVSSIYRSPFMSTCNIKWKTDWEAGERTPRHWEQPAALSPRNGAVHLYPQSQEERSSGRTGHLAWAQRMRRYCQGRRLLLRFRLSPRTVSMQVSDPSVSSEGNHWFLPQTAKNPAEYFTFSTLIINL